MQNLIETRRIHKEYRTSTGVVTNVLNEINLKINSGEFVAIMGPSGSGKSTFMNILGCLDKPTIGEYLLNGKNTSSMSEDELADVRNHLIGFIFQNFNLLSRRSALSNVELPMIYAGIPAKERMQRAKELLIKVGLEKQINSHPNQMSGGQQQRVAIARALANNPKLILADEPTGNLDTATSNEVMQILTDLNNSGITVVIVTHEPDIARATKRLVKFRDGIITYDGVMKPEETMV